MKRIKIRLISYVLILSTLLSIICLPAWAEDETPAELPEGVTVVSEDVSRRGEFEKHYLLSDGTYLATTYAEAVHFKDDNGVWQDIDTTLSYDSQSASYKTGNNGFDAEFMTESASVKLKNKNGKELSWHYELIGTDNEKAVMKLQKKNAKAQKSKIRPPSAKLLPIAMHLLFPTPKAN